MICFEFEIKVVCLSYEIFDSFEIKYLAYKFLIVMWLSFLVAETSVTLYWTSNEMSVFGTKQKFKVCMFES